MNESSLLKSGIGLASLVAFLLPPCGARAELSVAPVFSDHMVLQAGAPLPVWGTATPGAAVAVALEDDLVETVADSEGRWRVTLAPRPPSSRGARLAIESGDQTLVRTDVLLGEVWLCAGQSNMEWPLRKAADGKREVAAASHPQIRLLNRVGAARGGSGEYTAQHLERMTPEKFCRGAWEPCSPKSAADFSAVAYYFGRRLHQQLNVPIGLVSPAIGGTPAEAWIRRDALESDPDTVALVQGNWLENPNLEPWCQKRAAYNLRRAQSANEAIPGDDLGPNHSFKPGFMWDAAMAPLVPYALKGFLWYQGESNAESEWRTLQHAKIFPLLVRDWRRQWNQGDLPFGFVQLPALGRPHWPLFREGQRTLRDALPNVGMAVAIDVGHPTNVHPLQKRPVGERLAQWALADVYRHPIVPSGPLLSSVRQEGRRARVAFRYAQSGLATTDGKPPVGFEVAGDEGAFVPAVAQLDEASIVLSAEGLAHITRVRYGWAPFPQPPLNLTNRQGLPASPFLAPHIMQEAPR